MDAIDVLTEARVRVASEKNTGGHCLMILLTWAAFDLQARPKENPGRRMCVIVSDTDGRRGVANRNAVQAKSTSCRMTCLRYRTDTRGRRSYGAFRFPFEFRYSCS